MDGRWARHGFGLFALLAVLLSSLPGCQWLDSRKAEGVTKRFVQAAVEGDYATIREITDPEGGYENAKYLIEREFGSADAQRRLDGLTLKTVSIDGERATVQAVGTLRYAIPFIAATVPVELEVELVKKKHRWYVHDVDTL